MTIFVNIAAYNDPLIHRTLESLKANSDNFDDITVGICWQSDDPLKIDYPNVQTISMPLLQARGVGYARSVADIMRTTQEYCLVVDSHTLFAPSWDTRIVEHYQRLQQRFGEQITMSCYAPGWAEYGRDTTNYYTVPQPGFNEYGILRFRGIAPLSRDTLFPCMSCHFIFAVSKFFDEIPHDPAIFYTGEEIALTVKSFTHGWSNIQPACPYVYHRYKDLNALNVPWKDNPNWSEFDEVSLRRVRLVCYAPYDGLGSYGKGTARQLSLLETTLQVDFERQLVYGTYTGII